jgi:hypothetical protein
VGVMAIVVVAIRGHLGGGCGCMFEDALPHRPGLRFYEAIALQIGDRTPEINSQRYNIHSFF